MADQKPALTFECIGQPLKLAMRQHGYHHLGAGNSPEKGLIETAEGAAVQA